MSDEKRYRLDGVRGMPAGNGVTWEGLSYYANPGRWSPNTLAVLGKRRVDAGDLQRAAQAKLRELADEWEYEVLKAGLR
jgi:hypothetical protein